MVTQSRRPHSVMHPYILLTSIRTYASMRMGKQNSDLQIQKSQMKSDIYERSPLVRITIILQNKYLQLEVSPKLGRSRSIAKARKYAMLGIDMNCLSVPLNLLLAKEVANFLKFATHLAYSGMFSVPYYGDVLTQILNKML